MSDFIVLGGGLAGLTFAWEATRRGKQVVVLERGAQVGGLARTLTFGDYRFDIGGHRFVSKWPHITEWVLELMGDDMLKVPRRSRIHLNGRFVNYPLEMPNALTAFSLPKALHVVASYLKTRFLSTNHQEALSFEDWVVHRFGRALYEIYFRPYTEKVWGIPCTELSADWASQRIKLPSLGTAVKGSLLGATAPPGTLVSRFHYPRLGIGMIPDRLARQTEATGRGTIHLSAEVCRLENDDEDGWRVHYRQDGERKHVTGQKVISTIPLVDLVEMLPDVDGVPPAPYRALSYRSLTCVFLSVDSSQISSDTWTYFPEPELTVGRTHEPPNWSRDMAPPDSTSLCVEIFCTEGDDVWRREDEELVNAVLQDLDGLGFLARERVQDSWVHRVADAYPVYHVGYADILHQVRDYLTRWSSLHLTGRTGSFEYMNMDKVIKEALRLAEDLAGAA